MKKIYIAHPMGKNNIKEVFSYYEDMKSRFKTKYEILTPLKGKEFLSKKEKDFTRFCCEDRINHPIVNNHSIFRTDLWMIEQSDVFFCDFSKAEELSVGCLMELGIAYSKNKHTVIVLNYLSDYHHTFIQEAADIIFYNTKEALEYLDQIGAK